MGAPRLKKELPTEFFNFFVQMVFFQFPSAKTTCAFNEESINRMAQNGTDNFFTQSTPHVTRSSLHWFYYF